MRCFVSGTHGSAIDDKDLFYVRQRVPMSYVHICKLFRYSHAICVRSMVEEYCIFLNRNRGCYFYFEHFVPVSIQRRLLFFS